MARTQAQLAKFVLRDVLGVIAADETPSADDDAEVDDAYTDALEELRDEEIAYWDANAIPNVVFRSVADFVGARVGPAFGIPRDFNLEADAMKRLRRHIAKRSSGEPTKAQYF